MPYKITISLFVPLVILLGCANKKESNSFRDQHSKVLGNPVFVFNNAFHGKEQSYSFEEQAAMLRTLGFDGIEHREVKGILELKEVFEKYDLNIYADYMSIDIDLEEPYLPEWGKVMPKLNGTGIVLWTHIHSEKFEPSDENADELIVPILQELADLARPYGVKIAIYPHVRFLAEKAEDSYRLAMKTNRDNVGSVFNLCHFLKTDSLKNLRKTIDLTMPKLFAVSLSGADSGDTQRMEWDQLIQPLGEGNLNVYEVIKYLADKGYQGPVGIQCYNIKGRPEEFLRKSSAAWKNYKKRYEIE